MVKKRAVKPWNRLIAQERRLARRFRSVNIFLFVMASFVLAVASYVVLRGVTGEVSEDYAGFYAANTSLTLSSHLGREIAVLAGMANSNAVMEWLNDESNAGKKYRAHEEMADIIPLLSNSNIYMAANRSFNEYILWEGSQFIDFSPVGVLDPDNPADSWYFEMAGSPYDYTLNVDIDKVLNRELVWINYKIMHDGRIIGAMTTGIEFSNLMAEVFAGYDDSKVRSLIIDENGCVIIDSLRSEHLYSVRKPYISEKLSNREVLDAAAAYVNRIDSYFTLNSEPVVIGLNHGSFSHATIAPIGSTPWSVVTLYDSSTLFDLKRFAPLLSAMVALFIMFAVTASAMSYRLFIAPFEALTGSLVKLREDGSGSIYGLGREDEFGDLAGAIQEMKDRLDSYNTDLESEVEERSAHLRQALEQVEEKNQVILSSIDYARRIQKSLLPKPYVFEAAFKDHSIIWNPRDRVGGDIYWIKSFEAGTVLCVCDCTGHGAPGAILAMLVVSAFDSFINESNCHDTPGIIWELEQRFSNVLNINTENLLKKRKTYIKNGCDLAAVFIAKDGHVDISSANTHVFTCDGKSVNRIRGQRLFVGEGKIKSKDVIKTVTIPAGQNLKFYIASDGLYDQIGFETRKPFGYARLEKVILDYHEQRQSVISSQIWRIFEAYRGGELRRDDFQVISFVPRICNERKDRA